MTIKLSALNKVCNGLLNDKEKKETSLKFLRSHNL